MSRYDLFRNFLNFIAMNYEVTGANMNNYSGDIEIRGKKNGQEIKITVELKEEEEKKDD